MTSDARAQPRNTPPEAPLSALQSRAVFEAIPGGVPVISAPSGRRFSMIADVNQELCAMTGYSFDELIGMNPLRLVLPSDRRRQTTSPLRWLT